MQINSNGEKGIDKRLKMTIGDYYKMYQSYLKTCKQVALTNSAPVTVSF